VLISLANKPPPLEQASITGAPAWYASGNDLLRAHRADAPVVSELPLVHKPSVPAISRYHRRVCADGHICAGHREIRCDSDEVFSSGAPQ
jgi:hypothetical protein